MSDIKKQCIEKILVISCIVFSILVILVLSYYSWDMINNIILK